MQTKFPTAAIITLVQFTTEIDVGGQGNLYTLLEDY